jgi:hypothetical protein
MSMESWVTLWIILLWLSAGAFGLVTIYVLGGLLRRFGKSS